MFDIVAPDQDELSLPVEAKGVDQAQSGLPGSAAGDAQPMRKHQPIDDRQNHQSGDPAGRQNSVLDNTIVAERKIT
jgi:hypothetical protein